MGTVLVVDDDDDIRRLVARALAEHHEVREARDAKEALAALEAGDPDVIVCDVMMPAETGLEFARRIRSAGKKIPVVFLTAKASPLDVVEGINAGARAYVTKPFKLAPLVERIDRIIAGRKSQPAKAG